MSSSEGPVRRRLLQGAALLGVGLILLGCAERPVGRMQNEALFGLSPNYNIHVQAGGAPAADRLAALLADFEARVPNVVTFDFDEAALDAEAAEAVDRQAAWLKAHPGALVRVYGHADLVGTEPYNARIGLRRARAVAARLMENGVARERLEMIASMGETEPVVPVEARERRNRRAVTVVEGYGAAWRGGRYDGKRALLAYRRYTMDEAEAVQIDTAGGGG
jgi:outer membrane protein OmpA-like peptidoglycan-associated protein